MARRLGSEQNEMLFQDNLSGTEICLRYRMPTTRERVGYVNECFVRKGKKLENRSVETRLKYGLRILTGFRTGDFEIEVDGAWVPISSDADSEHYSKDWRAVVSDQAADLVELLAIRVFDTSVQLADPDAVKEAGAPDDKEEEGEDLEKK